MTLDGSRVATPGKPTFRWWRHAGQGQNQRPHILVNLLARPTRLRGEQTGRTVLAAERAIALAVSGLSGEELRNHPEVPPKAIRCLLGRTRVMGAVTIGWTRRNGETRHARHTIWCCLRRPLPIYGVDRSWFDHRFAVVEATGNPV